MASVSTYKDGKKRIQFFTADGKRRSIRLGTISKAAARDVAKSIAHLVRCSKTGEEPNGSTLDWIRMIQRDWPMLARKLTSFGLIGDCATFDQVFADFVEGYIASRRDVKPGTIRTWSQASQKIRVFFGNRTLKTLTTKDGKDFLRWLRTPKSEGGAGHKGATPSKHLGHVRGFLNEAVDAQIIAANPFRSVTARRTPQEGRKQIIPVESVLRVIQVAPDAEMRALIALSFWGGLRTPSEQFVLKWGAIDWRNRMMTIKSPKTEGVGKESRETPLFPELLPYLKTLKQAVADNGPDDFVIQHRRQFSETNVRNQMYRLCDKAGVKRWPKIFQNLRSTRQTILERYFPRGTVCAWMGNTEDVAEAHYVQELQEFRLLAASNPTTDVDAQGVVDSPPDKKRSKVVQKVAQSSQDLDRIGEKTGPADVYPNSAENECFPVLSRHDSSFLEAGTSTRAEVDGNRTHQARVNAPQRF